MSAAYLSRALPAVALLVVAEYALLPLGRVRTYLPDAWDWLLLAVQGLALVPVLALLPAAVELSARWLGRFQWVGRHARWALPVLFLVGAQLMVGNGPGHRIGLGPWWAEGAVLLATACVWLCWRLVPEEFQGTTTALGLLGAAFWYWVFAHHSVDFFFGRLGVGDPKRNLRTGVLGALALATFLGPALAAWALRLVRRSRFRVVSAVAGLALALAGWWANATFYVDDYLPFHDWLLAFSLGSVTWAGLVLSERLPVIPARRAWPALVLLPALVGVGLGTADIRSRAGYVGAVHAVFQRFGLELVHHHIPNLPHLPATRLAYLRNRLARLKGRPLPPRRHGRLPSTFARLERHPDLARRDIHGVVIFFLDRKRTRDIWPYSEATPEVARWFRDAFVFERCVSAAVSTEISFPAIYTSSYAATRHQRLETNLRLPYYFSVQRGRNLPRIFRQAGWETMVVSNRWYMGVFFRSPLKAALFGGFQKVVGDDPGIRDQTKSLEAAYRRTGGLVPRRGRYLLVFHIQSHALSDLPNVDHFIGKICREVHGKGRSHDTVLLLTADHGVQFREHGRTSYGHTLFEEEVRVPLLVRVPGVRGRRISVPVSSVDHLPFLADLLDLPTDLPMEGRSYLPLLAADPTIREQAEAAFRRRIIFSETRIPARSLAAVQGDLKLIRWVRTGTQALFDLAEDPAERVSLWHRSRYRRAWERLSRAVDRFLEERDETRWPW